MGTRGTCGIGKRGNQLLHMKVKRQIDRMHGKG